VRQRALASVRRELVTWLAELEERVSPCAPGGVELSLTVESEDGGIRVVDARLASGDSTTDVELACARSALRGERLAAPAAAAGSRWELSLSVRARRSG
jgi:hypothetical protein